jgi:hypothetical protein
VFLTKFKTNDEGGGEIVSHAPRRRSSDQREISRAIKLMYGKTGKTGNISANSGSISSTQTCTDSYTNAPQKQTHYNT